MKLKSLLAATLGLALALSALTGVALAGKPDDPGKSEDAPGQVKKAENAPAPAQGKSGTAPGRTKTGKAATPSKGKSAQAKAKASAKKSTKSAAKPQQENNGRSAEAHHHVIVCHATGSAKNPYVVINIPMTAWTEAHDHHQDGRDFILKDPASRPGSKDGFDKSDCAAPAQLLDQKVEEKKKVEQGCPPFTTTTVTTTVTGVEHKPGQKLKTNPKSAHSKLKHGDVPKSVTETQTVVTGGKCEEKQEKQEKQDALQQAQQEEQVTQEQAAQKQAAAQQEQGGVLGAQAEVRQPAKGQGGQGGVLGRIGAVAQQELPFTGLPLWIALLAGAALVGAGVGIRKSMR